MRYLGIDYGNKRVGVALCDPTETIVSPLRQLDVDARAPQRLIGSIQNLIAEHQVDAVVVGLPVNMDDTEGPQAKQARQFADQLQKTLNVPVHLQDERLSSAAADEKLAQVHLTKKQKKKRRDMIAACEILNNFIDQKSDTKH